MKVSVEQSSWSGPLPAPSDMMKYDQIVSNGAERIFTAWEEESKHRRELERKSFAGLFSRAFMVNRSR
ncbi:hypothetical protein DEA98_14120 [Brucella pseudogrignonensis]|nr:hypothetical protein [Brucella pseudogrignonensis]